MRKFILILILTSYTFTAFTQTANHWETAISANDTWKYFVGTSQPTAGWTQLNYSESSWLSGTGGFGYGDNDDGTIIAKSISVFLRKKFTIKDLSKFTKAVLHGDFDDGFIAYLNGVEIARYAMNGTLPTYDTPAASFHEANLYQGLQPETFEISKEILKKVMINGENILAIQVHNENASSSDLSSNFFLSFGIVDNSVIYSTPPSWFVAPVPFSTNLPIISLTTNGLTIPDEPRIVANMAVINNKDKLNTLDDAPNEYNSRVTIELRGSSSLSFPKKSYSLETQDPLGENLNVSLLGMPAENDWILYAPYTDKALIRNTISYKLARDLGKYAPRTHFCELFLNGQYQGIYELTEKIKPDKNRVNIDDMYSFETYGYELTGGYMLKFDRTDAGNNGWYTANYVPIAYHYPDMYTIAEEQRNYIRSFVTEFETNLASSNFEHPTNGYAKYIDTESFIDFFFINEITKNVDGYRLSSFLYKEKLTDGGKINMGPVWDFNLGCGNADYFDGGALSGFSYLLNSYAAPMWWQRLLESEVYTTQLKCKWEAMRKTKLNTDTIFAYIDSTVAYLNDAQKRNYQKWNILNQYVWPNEYIGGTYENEISYLKTWINNRMNWLDANMPGTCAVNSISENENQFNGLKIYPNPFSENISIEFYAQEMAEYEVRITNITGQIVHSEIQKVLAQTTIEFRWNAKANNQMPVESGFYICQILKNGQLETSQKIVKQ